MIAKATNDIRDTLHRLGFVAFFQSEGQGRDEVAVVQARRKEPTRRTVEIRVSIDGCEIPAEGIGPLTPAEMVEYLRDGYA
jgi:hypothetical protein